MSGPFSVSIVVAWRHDGVECSIFYAGPLSQAENLFRSALIALYDCGKLIKGDLKEPWLKRLREDGVYLIDLAPTPVNALASSTQDSVSGFLRGKGRATRSHFPLRNPNNYRRASLQNVVLTRPSTYQCPAAWLPQ